MVRVYCDRCGLVVNMYPQRDNNRKILFWKADNPRHQCNHKLTLEEKERFQVHVRWFLKDGTELVSKSKRPQWELRRPDGKIQQ